MKVYVHFAEGFEEIEALTVVDVLRRASIEAEMVSVSGNLMVTGAHAITVKTDILFEQADYATCDMIVLPGGMPGAANLEKHEGLSLQIKQFVENEKWLAAICAAPMVFGQMGLLKNRTAVCYPGFEDKLLGAKLGRHTVEIDGKFITSRGPGTALEFAFVLVESLKDKTTARGLRMSMLAE